MTPAIPVMRFNYSDQIVGTYEPQPLRLDLVIGTRQGDLRHTVRRGLDERCGEINLTISADL